MSQSPSQTYDSPDRSSTTGQVLRALLPLLLAAIGGLYAIVPIFYQGALCPADSIVREGTGSVLVPALGGTLLTVSSLYLVLGLMPRYAGRPGLKSKFLENLSVNNRSAFVAIMSSGIFVSGCVWINNVASYHCFTPSNIYVHPWALAPVQTLTWADVTAIRAHCWTIKHGVAGGVTVFLDGSESIEVSNARAVANAMRGRSYRYVMDASVSQYQCPAHLYPLFVHWPG